jgi:hypothetical protein
MVRAGSGDRFEMANHRIYQYTSIGRPLDPSYVTNKAVLVMMPISAVVGAAVGWFRHADPLLALQQALLFALVLFVSWALARELDPDDNPAAFISLGCGLLVALALGNPGILIAFVTLGLVRIVNRSTGLAARKTDSVVLTILSIVVIYVTGSPMFGVVAALAFVFDGSLKDPLRHQWLFGLVCLGATVVYMVDHDISLGQIRVPDALFEWLSVLVLLIFALNILLTKKVRSKGDIGRRPLDVKRVRGGMTVGLLAALQGINELPGVAVIVAVIAGICIGMAFRKRFRTPVAA